MSPSDYDVTAAMIRYGGSFVQKLGELLRVADPENCARLKACYPEIWMRYRDVAATQVK